MSQPSETCRIAMVLFPGLTQLDLTGPYEILARMPGAELSLVSGTLDPVRTDRGLVLTPDATYEDMPDPDILFVPGGPGQLPAMDDAALMAYLRRAGKAAQLITSVCTGSLLLAAAGLLMGKKATCHWLAHDQLALLGAVPVHQRVVEDGNVITGAGVSSGIDFGLVVAERLHGARVAQEIQLQAEYDPSPPHDSGSADKAPPEVVEALRRRGAALREKRIATATRIGAALRGDGTG
ncbi:MAG: DJ-1/PfpI family protein [Alphaproteobacteria bacterium]|nr:DJ-1/PfpI family protein [Alphaproteobacteria bacterium]